MNSTTSDLPPELQPFASPLDVQPPEVQEAFQFLLATAMHEAGKFGLLSVAEVDGRWHQAFKDSVHWFEPDHRTGFSVLYLESSSRIGLGSPRKLVVTR